jgi:hypothetical protein
LIDLGLEGNLSPQGLVLLLGPLFDIFIPLLAPFELILKVLLLRSDFPNAFLDNLSPPFHLLDFFLFGLLLFSSILGLPRFYLPLLFCKDGRIPFIDRRIMWQYLLGVGVDQGFSSNVSRLSSLFLQKEEAHSCLLLFLIMLLPLDELAFKAGK